MGLSHLDEEELAKWVGESLVTQGLAVTVTDPQVLQKVGRLLGARAV